MTENSSIDAIRKSRHATEEDRLLHHTEVAELAKMILKDGGKFSNDQIAIAMNMLDAYPTAKATADMKKTGVAQKAAEDKLTDLQRSTMRDFVVAVRTTRWALRVAEQTVSQKNNLPQKRENREEQAAPRLSPFEENAKAAIAQIEATFRKEQARLAGLSKEIVNLTGIARKAADTLLNVFPDAEPQEGSTRTMAAVTKTRKLVDFDQQHRPVAVELGIKKARRALQSAYKELKGIS